MERDARSADRPRPVRALAAAAALALLAACAAPPPFQREEPAPIPPTASTPGPGASIALAAEALIGAEYRYGGAGPDVFDCSGLVAYVHRENGIATPRTAAQQYAAARPVARDDLQPGDLVFFRLAGNSVSHVGVYVGAGRFVHAPQSGGRVREAALDEEFFRERYAGGGRLYPAPVTAARPSW